jgi:hypothetical protein
MSDLRRQDIGIPLRNIQLRIVQGILQAHRTKQEELRLSEGGRLSRHRRHAKEMSGVQVRQVSPMRNETRSNKRR